MGVLIKMRRFETQNPKSKMKQLEIKILHLINAYRYFNINKPGSIILLELMKEIEICLSEYEYLEHDYHKIEQEGVW